MIHEERTSQLDACTPSQATSPHLNGAKALRTCSHGECTPALHRAPPPPKAGPRAEGRRRHDPTAAHLSAGEPKGTPGPLQSGGACVHHRAAGRCCERVSVPANEVRTLSWEQEKRPTNYVLWGRGKESFYYESQFKTTKRSNYEMFLNRTVSPHSRL